MTHFYCPKSILFCLLLLIGNIGQAQDSTATIAWSGYVEAFYAYDANRPADNRRPAFLYSHNRQNEININLAYLKAAYTGANTRANLALGIGTYMSDNYAAEPVGVRNILEANAGIRLGSRTWLDAGVLPSHIGFESAVSKDCWALTRSLMAENSPYFETGIKITHTPNDKWTLAILALNGWQRIARINSSPAVGTQLTYKPSDKITLNWSTYTGNERPDSARQWRFFNNFYGIFQWNARNGLTVGVDAGVQEGALWLTPALILRSQFSHRWTLVARIENYTDRDGVIIAPDFSVSGTSLGFDFSASSNALLRFEGRYLGSDRDWFWGKKDLKKGTLYGTAALTVSF